MGDVVRLQREAARPVSRSYEDPRWADLHAPVAVTPGSGNVSADLGLPEAGRLLAEANVRIAAADCRCTAGHVCRHNNACPRSGR